AGYRAGSADRLLVGVVRGRLPTHATELAAELDTTLVESSGERYTVAVADTTAAAQELHRIAARHTHAALLLGQVLRRTEHLPVPHALDVESLAYSTLLGTPDFRRWLHERGLRPLPPPAPQEPVLLRRDGEVLHLTLNRPERRNAYGAEVRDALVEALHVARADETVTRVVLDGAGPVFSAGGDLDEFGTTPDLATAHLIRTRAGAGRLVAELAARIEAHLHGSCIGAGIEIPAFASRVVATPGTLFRLPEVSMGLIPGAGGTVSIPRRIGRWRSLWLFLTGVALDAETALSWGLVDALD
ncbi:MAG: enoyl-CoA hydratase/isomerase family protein, partial [Aldersonia sp.]|nr:enoyl-CoA hydratase/isomerase family protein [Aldersonia sp.]